MNYKVYKLKFITPVRFSTSDNQGSLYNSDYTTPASILFSSLYISALEINEKELLEYFVSEKFLLSNLMPYVFDTLYIPKPILQFTSEKDVNRKKMKKLNFIPIDMINEYFKNPMKIIEQEEHNKFGYFSEKTKVNRMENEESLPYTIETFEFEKDCGLYFIANVPSNLENAFIKVLELLGKTGIGGKKSSGYGKFVIDEIKVSSIYEKLLNKSSNYYLSLSSFIPREEELKAISEGTYLLNIKSGFSYSYSYSDSPIKKENKLTIQQGSCFKEKLKGQLYVEQNGKHPIYTFGRALMIGVDINE